MSKPWICVRGHRLFMKPEDGCPVCSIELSFGPNNTRKKRQNLPKATK